MTGTLIEAVKNVKNGDKDAFTVLYEEFAQTVYFQVSNIVGEKSDADNIVQEVFITAYEKIGDLNTPEAFPAWLGKIASNKSLDYLRERQTAFEDSAESAVTDSMEFFEELDPELIPDKALDNAETARIIYEIIQDLPLSQRACIHFYYYEQLSVKEIAENLAVSENTVKTRLSLARKKIREELEKREEKDGLKLWMASPLAIIPILKFALQGTQVPASLVGNVTSALGIGAEAAGATVAASAAGASTAAGTTAATTTSAAGMAATATGTTAATKIVVASVASVAVTAGIITGVMLLGDEDEAPDLTLAPTAIVATVESTATPTLEPTPTPNLDYEYHYLPGIGDSGVGMVITKYIGSSTDVIVPATIEGKPVVAIGTAAFTEPVILTYSEGRDSIQYEAFRNANLTSVILPDGLVRIRDSAFSGCTELSSVTFPEGLLHIGDYAFADCISLTDIVLPDGLLSIGSSAFRDCLNLKSVFVPDSTVEVNKGAFMIGFFHHKDYDEDGLTVFYNGVYYSSEFVFIDDSKRYYDLPYEFYDGLSRQNDWRGDPRYNDGSFS